MQIYLSKWTNCLAFTIAANQGHTYCRLLFIDPDKVNIKKIKITHLDEICNELKDILYN